MIGLSLLKPGVAADREISVLSKRQKEGGELSRDGSDTATTATLLRIKLGILGPESVVFICVAVQRLLTFLLPIIGQGRRHGAIMHRQRVHYEMQPHEYTDSDLLASSDPGELAGSFSSFLFTVGKTYTSYE
eukprot:1344946-Amorphochlora_amoeboformis.AAC.1